jgi:AP-1 complex subunit beta-1
VEVKKLVYLYLINYAKSNPDLTIMAVNAFVKDSEHASPLIRALAIRTMGCIRVEKITEYLAPPLKKALGDEDPYVRKTAALCVAKLFDISPAIVKQQGFIEAVRDLLSDANPTVVANAVAALSEIQESSGKEVFEVTSGVLQKLLAALNECTEWGQVFILDSLARYMPSDAREAENIIERVSPRLVHQNPAVVLSAVKIILMYMEVVTNVETTASICRKLAPPLVTLAQSSSPEVQYVALRNIALIVQRRPHLLSHKVKVFFCKYNDPIYVKMEKLDILVALADAKNVESVLLELREYASEVDVEYVRRAVRTIGRCAIKLETAAEKCIKVLLQLIATKVNYVVQEAVVVIKDIFRRYPNRYETILGVLCSSLESLDEPEAKSSMIWIVGEYADRIDNAGELLAGFLDSFHEETTGVQLALLTACVKLFLKKPAESEELVQAVLAAATERSDNPDLRDRGYIYWRLLSTDPDAAKAVVLAERPVIQDDSGAIEPALLDVLTRNIATLAAVYHKPPEAFVRRTRATFEEGVDEDDGGDVYGDDEVTSGGDAPAPAAGSGGGRTSAAPRAPVVAPAGDMDLLGMGGGGRAVQPAGAAAAPSGGLDDLFGSAPAPARAAPAAAFPTLPFAAEKDGLAVSAGFSRKAGTPVMELVIEHKSGPGAPVDSGALKFNLNLLGLSPSAPAVAFRPAAPVGGKTYAAVPLAINPSLVATAPGDAVQAALRENGSGRVVFFPVPIGPFFSALFTEDGAVDAREFVAQWRTMGEDKQAAEVAREVACGVETNAVVARLARANIFSIANRPGPTPELSLSYFSARCPDPAAGSPNGTALLFELTFKAGLPAVKVVCKCARQDLAKLGCVGLVAALKTQ